MGSFRSFYGLVRLTIPNDFGKKIRREQIGRYYWDKKDTVENCTSISTSFLRENGYFDGFRSGWIVWSNSSGEETASMIVTASTSDAKSHLRLSYTMTDRNTREKMDFDYEVQLETTPCNYGGIRWWFICPLNRNGIHCGRRVAKLYLAPGADYYGCRHCYDLSYNSRNRSRRGLFGQLGYILKAHWQIGQLRGQIKRHFYAGEPTRKFRKLLKTQERLGACLDSPAVRQFMQENQGCRDSLTI